MLDQTSTTAPHIVKNSSVQKDSSSSEDNKDTTETIAVTKESIAPEHVPAALSVVYVGNLSLRTKERGLAALFEPIGKVLNTKIITIPYRNKRRSAGYGFITFATTEEVLKAIEEFDNTLLDGREIRVQVARSNPRIVSKSQAVGEVSTSSVTIQSSSIPVNDTDRGVSENADQKDERAAQVYTGNMNNKTQSDSASVDSEVLIVKPRGSDKKWRLRRPKKSETEPSPSTIFVTNLKYSSTDNMLKEVFKDYEIKSVCVVKTPTGRSTGYGFVNMVSPQERTKALASIKTAELEGRKIYLKVARSQGSHPETSNDDVDVGHDGEQERYSSQKNNASTSN